MQFTQTYDKENLNNLMNPNRKSTYVPLTFSTENWTSLFESKSYLFAIKQYIPTPEEIRYLNSVA